MAPGLFWFFLGAGAATYYIDKKQTQKNILNYPSSASTSYHANSGCTHHGSFQSPPVQQIPPVQQSQQQFPDTVIPGGGDTTHPDPQDGQYQHRGYSFRRWSWGGMGVRDEPFTHTQTQTQTQTQNQAQPFAFPWHSSGWDDEKARMKMREFGKRADDVMTDLSDATLDALTTTVELLRDKLAEHRLQREQAKGAASLGQGEGQGEKTTGYV